MHPETFVWEDVLRSMVVVVSNGPELHGYCVRSLYRVMLEWSGQEGLAQVSVWCIAEYREIFVNNLNELSREEPLTMIESDAVDVIETVLKDIRTSKNTQAYALTTLLKLSSRFPTNSQPIKDLIQLYKGNLTLELQQRSLEFGAILNRHENIKAVLVENMPLLDEAAYSLKKADGVGMALPVDAKRSSLEKVPDFLTNGGPKVETTNALIDLLNLDAHDTLPAQQRQSTQGDQLLSMLGGALLRTSPVGASAGGTNILQHILSFGETPVSTPSASPNPLTGLFQPTIKDPFAAYLLDVADPPLPGGGQSGVGPKGFPLDADNGSSGVDRERKLMFSSR